jgi:hypothetical protein
MLWRGRCLPNASGWDCAYGSSSVLPTSHAPLVDTAYRRLGTGGGWWKRYPMKSRACLITTAVGAAQSSVCAEVIACFIDPRGGVRGRWYITDAVVGFDPANKQSGHRLSTHSCRHRHRTQGECGDASLPGASPGP